MSSLSKFRQNIYLVIPCFTITLVLHRGESRTPKAIKMKIFVSAIYDFKPLTDVTKNFVVDGSGMLDSRDRLSIKL